MLALTGPVTQGFEMVGEGYITERGSVFDSIAATRVRVNLASELRRATFTLSESP